MTNRLDEIKSTNIVIFIFTFETIYSIILFKDVWLVVFFCILHVLLVAIYVLVFISLRMFLKIKILEWAPIKLSDNDK